MEQDLDPTALVESDNLDDPNESDDSDQALFVPAAETPHIEAPDQVGSQSSDDDDDDDWKIVEGIELAHDVPSIKLLSVSQTAHVVRYVSAQLGAEVAKSSTELTEQRKILQDQYRGFFSLPNRHWRDRANGEQHNCGTRRTS